MRKSSCIRKNRDPVPEFVDEFGRVDGAERLAVVDE